MLTHSYLQGVSYGVFGLGNKQYEHFCAVGLKVHAAMEQLGAQPIVRRGDGDDDVDIDADFESWRTELYSALDASSLLDQKEARILVAQTPISSICVVPQCQQTRSSCCRSICNRLIQTVILSALQSH